MQTLDNHAIELPCPHCGRKISQTIGKLKANPHLTCPGCKGGIDIKADQLRRAVDGINKQLTDLKRALGRLGK